MLFERGPISQTVVFQGGFFLFRQEWQEFSFSQSYRFFFLHSVRPLLRTTTQDLAEGKGGKGVTQLYPPARAVEL